MKFRNLSLLFAFLLIPVDALAKEEIRVYQTDVFGNIRYDKPSVLIKGNTVIVVDEFGNVRHDKPKLKIQKKR